MAHHPDPAGVPITAQEQRILAAVNAGEVMEGAALTDEDVAVVLRLIRGQSTVEDERDRLLAEIAARRETPHAPN